MSKGESPTPGTPSSKTPVATFAAPAAIGTYSQAVVAGSTVYISGQIPLDPNSMDLISIEFDKQAHQVFQNLRAVAVAAEGSLDHCVKLTVYLLDLNNFAQLNTIMSEYFHEPYPARAAVGVAQLPKGASIEIDAVMYLG